MEKFLKTNDVAKICHVTQGTVIRWIKEGKLSASSTAGGHNLIPAGDLVKFLKDLRLPIPSELTQDESPRVLIVDDEPQVRNMIRWMIERHFPEVKIEEAHEGFIAGWKVHSFNPHLVLLDIMMPGLDGFHICEFIRQFPELKKTKIIVISAFMDPEVEKKMISLGADDFLTKPFELDVLKKKIFSQLNGVVKGASHEAA